MLLPIQISKMIVRIAMVIATTDGAIGRSCVHLVLTICRTRSMGLGMVAKINTKYNVSWVNTLFAIIIGTIASAPAPNASAAETTTTPRIHDTIPVFDRFDHATQSPYASLWLDAPHEDKGLVHIAKHDTTCELMTLFVDQLHQGNGYGT
jgi:hypothetical protein